MLLCFEPHVETWSCRRLRPQDAVDEQLERARGQTGGVDRVRACECVDVEPVGGLRVEELDRRCETAHLHTVGVAVDGDVVVAVGALDDDLSGDSVTGCAEEADGEIDVHVLDVRAGQVVHRDDVGAAERVEVDPLDAVGVHRDVARAAEEAEVVSVRGQVDRLRCGGPVEPQRVGAGVALDRVAAVAGIPDERVVTGPELGRVGAAVPVDRVVAVPAEQQLVAWTAGDPVFPGATVEAVGDRLGREAGGRDRVVAAEAVKRQLVCGLLVGDRDACLQAGRRQHEMRLRQR